MPGDPSRVTHNPGEILGRVKPLGRVKLCSRREVQVSAGEGDCVMMVGGGQVWHGGDIEEDNDCQDSCTPPKICD